MLMKKALIFSGSESSCDEVLKETYVAVLLISSEFYMLWGLDDRDGWFFFITDFTKKLQQMYKLEFYGLCMYPSMYEISS